MIKNWLMKIFQVEFDFELEDILKKLGIYIFVFTSSLIGFITINNIFSSMIFSIFLFGCILYLISWWTVKKEIQDVWQGFKIMEVKKSNKLHKEWKQKYPILEKIQDFYYTVNRWFEIPGDTYRVIKWFIQRGKNGYADCDVWSLNYYIDNVMSKALKDLIEQIHGCPVSLSNSDDVTDKDFNEWKRILGELKWLFEQNIIMESNEVIYVPYEKERKKLENYVKRLNQPRKPEDKIFPELPDPYYRVMTKKECKRYKEAWKLLQKYWFSLWD